MRVFLSRQTNALKAVRGLTITSLLGITLCSNVLKLAVNSLPDNCLQLELSRLKRMFFKRNACKRDKNEINKPFQMRK